MKTRLLFTALLLASSPLLAQEEDTIEVERIERGDVLLMEKVERGPDRAVPATGLDMSQVENRYGAPVTRVEPVGDPPITRWIYDGFTVYFEHDKVIHAVVEPRIGDMS